MIEVQGDLWATDAENIALTTNGATRRDGSAVMGAGIAKQAVQRCPGIDRALGALLREIGNRVHYLGTWNGKGLWSFPTKHSWSEDSEPELIQQSALQLCAYMNARAPEKARVALPRPGCLNGNLRWPDVRKVLAPVFKSDAFVITDRAPPLAATPQKGLALGMVVAFAGSRDFPIEKREAVYEMVGTVARAGARVVSGGAKGVDTWAEDAARFHGVLAHVYYADWVRYGPKAGVIRNEEMVAAADAVVAFWDGRSSGTADTIDRARRVGKIVRVILPEDA